MATDAQLWQKEFTRTTGRVATALPHPTRKGYWVINSDRSAPDTVWSGKELREATIRLGFRADFIDKPLTF